MVVIVQFVGHVPTVYGIPTAGNGLWIVASGIPTVGSLPTVVRWKKGCGLDWKSVLTRRQVSRARRDNCISARNLLASSYCQIEFI